MGLDVFVDVPRLEGGEEERGDRAVEDPRYEEDGVALLQLEQAAEDGDGRHRHGDEATAAAIGQPRRARPEEDGGEESDDVEDGNLVLLEAVVSVELVEVRHLEGRTGRVDKVP